FHVTGVQTCALPICALAHDLADLLPLLPAGQADPRTAHLLDGLLAADPAEDEEDRGQQVPVLEQIDRSRSIEPAREAGPRRTTVPAAAMLPATAGPAGRESATEAEQITVHLGCGVFVEERDQVAPREHVLLERDRPGLRHDDLRVAAVRPDPVAELLRVRHGRGEAHEAHAL